LEETFFVVILEVGLTFQYLKGAIGSIVKDSTNQEGTSIFQYLKGAIGSCDFYVLVSEVVHFNTSKVRLEGVGRHCRRGPRRKFQYLKGAIGRKSFITRYKSEGGDFNTSKVRLEGDDAPAALREGSLFQYLKGAIGRIASPYTHARRN